MTSLTAVATMAVLIFGPREAPAAGTHVGPDTQELVVVIDNLAGLSDAELDRVGEIAARIFSSARIRLVWTDRRKAIPAVAAPRMTAVLVPFKRGDPLLAGLRRPDSILGIAPPGTGRVHLFCDRIGEFAMRKGVTFERMLAVVLVHELGHHLLGASGHTRMGIMQDVMEGVLLTPRFTKGQIETMHVLLRARQRRHDEFEAD